MATVTTTTVLPVVSQTQKSIIGRRLGLGLLGGLTANAGPNEPVTPITNPAVGASIAVGDESGNVRIIDIYLKTAQNANIGYVQPFWIAMFSSAAMTTFATGGSTGIAIGTDGALLTVVTKKLFLATSEATGHVDLTWTDSGTESVSLAVILPNGCVVASAAFANA